jgi:FkbM family methyltransferase
VPKPRESLDSAWRASYKDLSRAYGDTVAVLRRARPTSAASWLVGLASRAPEIGRSRSLCPADARWQRRGARFRTPSGATVFLPGPLTLGAREMYCRNVYLRSGVRLPAAGWVLDLGSNRGLFSVLAAIEGADVVAVEAQEGYEKEIRALMALNRISPDRVRIETALIASSSPAVAQVGTVTDDDLWRASPYAPADRPGSVSVPELMDRYAIDRIAVLKMDIEGSEFCVMHPDSDLSWLTRVDQITMEVHPAFGSVPMLVETLAGSGLRVWTTDNEGNPVAAHSADVGYLYGIRPAHSADRSRAAR